MSKRLPIKNLVKSFSYRRLRLGICQRMTVWVAVEESLLLSLQWWAVKYDRYSLCFFQGKREGVWCIIIRAFSDFKPFYIFRLAALASEDVTISKPQISGCSMGARIQDVSVEFTLCFCR